MNLIPYWVIQFYIECGLTPEFQNLDYQIKNTAPKISSYFVWEVDNRPVAMCSWKEVASDCISVSAVYTPPTERKKGYASALVWSLCNKFKDKYKDIMLYADADYPQSNKIYQEIGFREIFSNVQYTFK